MQIVGDIVPRTNDPAERRRLRGMRQPTPAVGPSLDTVTATWAWTDQTNGLITWTFTNNTPNQVSFILLRNNYYFGNAFFPVYEANSSFGTHFASSLAPLSGSATQPLGVVGFPQPDGSSKYIACFIFTLAGNASWSTPEGGFTGTTIPSGISTHVVTERLNRETCIYYDPAQVTQYDNQEQSTDQGWTPNPSVFNTVVMDAAADATYIELYSNDSITNELKFASIMAADQPYQWWWGLSGDEVGQKLQASNMQLRNISAYVDLDNTVKFAVVMEPPTGQQWWWYWGQSGDEVGQLLTENNAQLTDISPYVAPDGSLSFAVIMVGAAGQGWWWYWGQTSDQVSALLQQNNAVLTKISPYWDADGSFLFAVIMAPNVGQGWWWYWGQSGDEVGQLLTENNAQLTDIAAYVNRADNTIRFAVIMTPLTGAAWWWWWGLDADGITQQMSANNSSPTVLTPYFGCG
jgi:hypothetical protein